MVDFTRTVTSLGFDSFPEPVEQLLVQAEWGHPLNRLRMGVVLTFALTENRHEKYVKYVVDELENGNAVYLIRPAWLNRGFDYKVCVEGWDNSTNPAPTHSEVYSDFYWKRERDSPEATEALCLAALDIYRNESADSALEKYGSQLDFTVGRIPEALLRPLPWLFIEQDIRYWNYDARNKTVGTIRDIQEGVKLENLSLYSENEDDNDLQSLDEIEESELAI